MPFLASNNEEGQKLGKLGDEGNEVNQGLAVTGFSLVDYASLAFFGAAWLTYYLGVERTRAGGRSLNRLMDSYRSSPAHNHSPGAVQPHNTAHVLAKIDPKNHDAHCPLLSPRKSERSLLIAKEGRAIP